MKKIALFSDIHGNVPALEAIINDIKSNNTDEIICLGDTLGLGPMPGECIDLIIDNNINMVLGNHELYYLRGTVIDDDMTDYEKTHHAWVRSKLNNKHFDFLNKCPLIIEKNINNKIMSFQHFLLKDNKDSNYPFRSLLLLKDNKLEQELLITKYDYMFFGHEHKPFEIEKNNRYFYCVGSSGCTRNNVTSYIILEVDNNIKVIRKEIEYNRKLFEEILNNSDYPEIKNISKHFFGI
jgi:predicted phosphodiesterase